MVLHSLEALILILLILTKTGPKGLLWLSKHVQVIHALLGERRTLDRKTLLLLLRERTTEESSEFWEGPVTERRKSYNGYGDGY